MFGPVCKCLYCHEPVDLVEWLRVREEAGTDVRVALPKGKLN